VNRIRSSNGSHFEDRSSAVINDNNFLEQNVSKRVYEMSVTDIRYECE
jgi:hypothetical protein